MRLRRVNQPLVWVYSHTNDDRVKDNLRRTVARSDTILKRYGIARYPQINMLIGTYTRRDRVYACAHADAPFDTRETEESGRLCQTARSISIPFRFVS